MIQDFSVRRDELTIRGRILRPEGGKLPAMILSHGFMGDMSGCMGYAEAVEKLGIAAVVFDFCGGGPGSSSDGDMTIMSVLTEKADLIAVIRYVQAQEWFDGTLYLTGFSQGGFVSALTAAQLQDEIKGLILIFPALCIPDDARRGQMLFCSFDPENIPETIPCADTRLGRIYPSDVIGMDPYREIAPYTGPVLLQHGTADSVVNISYAEKAAEVYENCRFEVIEGAGHGFGGWHFDISMKGMTAFLNEN